MGVLDFLFEGKAPPSVTTYGTSTTSMPQWMSDYMQGIVARANAVAGEGYQTYQGPRIADFNQDQQGGFDLTRANLGSYIPGMDLAESFETQAGGMSGLAAAAPYLQQASQTFPGAVDQYMNPYEEDVINKAKLDASNYYSDVLTPQLNAQFTAAGQYGSSQHEREALRAADKLTQGLQATSLAARAQGFDTAGQLFGQDMSRLGALGQTAGQLTGQDAAIKGSAGRDLASLAEARSKLGYADAAALSGVGAQQQAMDQSHLNLAYGDFQNQRDYDRQQVDWLNQIARGLPNPGSTTSTTNTGPMGNQYSPSTASSILGALSAIKGLWSPNEDGSDASWGDIWGDVKGWWDKTWGSGGGGGDTPMGEENDGWGMNFGFAEGGKVGALTDMMRKLESKATRPTFYVDTPARVRAYQMNPARIVRQMSYATSQPERDLAREFAYADVE